MVSASLFSSSEQLPLMFEKGEDSPGLVISINAGNNVTSSKVSATGYLQHVISDTERKTFHLSDYELK